MKLTTRISMIISSLPLVALEIVVDDLCHFKMRSLAIERINQKVRGDLLYSVVNVRMTSQCESYSGVARLSRCGDLMIGPSKSRDMNN